MGLDGGGGGSFIRPGDETEWRENVQIQVLTKLLVVLFSGTRNANQKWCCSCTKDRWGVGAGGVENSPPLK